MSAQNKGHSFDIRNRFSRLDVFEALPGEKCIDVSVVWLLCFLHLQDANEIKNISINLECTLREWGDSPIELCYPTGWKISLLLFALYVKFLPFPKKIMKRIILIFWVRSNVFEGRLLDNSPWTAANANCNLTGKSGTCFSFYRRRSWDLPSWSYQARQICPLVQRILYRLSLKQVWFVLRFFFFLGKTPNIFPLLYPFSSKFGWFGDQETSHLLDISASVSKSLTHLFSEIHINTFRWLPSQPVWRRNKPETSKHCTRYLVWVCIICFNHSDSLPTVIYDFASCAIPAFCYGKLVYKGKRTVA